MVVDKQLVRYSGGPMHGAEIEMPAELDPAALNLVITSGGIIYDRREKRPLRGARIVTPPGEPEPEPEPEPEKAAPKTRRRRSAPRKG